MYIMIERYMEKMTKEDVNNFAYKNNILLSSDELDFTYVFIKKNWREIIANPALVDLSRYKEKFSSENFVKIEKLFKE